MPSCSQAYKSLIHTCIILVKGENKGAPTLLLHPSTKNLYLFFAAHPSWFFLARALLWLNKTPQPKVCVIPWQESPLLRHLFLVFITRIGKSRAIFYEEGKRSVIFAQYQRQFFTIQKSSEIFLARIDPFTFEVVAKGTGRACYKKTSHYLACACKLLNLQSAHTYLRYLLSQAMRH